MWLLAMLLGVVGGQLDTNDPEVFALKAQLGNGQTGRCTATLIGRRTLLTAAHCIDPAEAGAAITAVIATNRGDASGVFPPDQKYTVVDMRMHPQWDLSSYTADIAVLAIAPPPAGIPTKALALIAPTGGNTRLVGYGVTNEGGSDGGFKREVDLPIVSLAAAYFWIGNHTTKGACTGDSGGPLLYDFGDGIERIAGVDSFNQAGSNCTYGGAARVDKYLSFINDTLAEFEAAQCSADDICLDDCTPADPDCDVVLAGPTGSHAPSGSSGPTGMADAGSEAMTATPDSMPPVTSQHGCAGVTWAWLLFLVEGARRRHR